MDANPVPEPRNGTKIFSPDVAGRLVQMVIGQGRTVSDAHRQIRSGGDGGAPTQISRTAVDRILRDARKRVTDTADVPAAAARVLRLASQELSALEAKQGPKDLDRLHKVAQILGTVERLRPRSKTEEATGLLSLQEQADT
jgi:hypothetical protein